MSKTTMLFELLHMVKDMEKYNVCMSLHNYKVNKVHNEDMYRGKY